MPAEAYRTASFKKKKQPRTILTTVQGKATGRTDTDSTAALLKYRKSSAPDPASVYHLTILNLNGESINFWPELKKNKARLHALHAPAGLCSLKKSL